MNWYKVQCALKNGQTFSGHYRAHTAKKALSWLFYDHKIKNKDIAETNWEKE